jgi:hypothetical protein
MVAVTAVAVSACGGSSKFANRPRPALPINITVYINNSRVSASPSTVTAGAVNVIVANHATQAEGLQIAAAGAGSSIASTAPINPQGTATLSVTLNNGSSYVLSTTSGATSEAALSNPPSIQPAQIKVRGQRPGSRNTLLTP